MQLLMRAQQNENQEIKLILQNLHRMHAEVLLNPFYQADYVMEDDGQDHTIFTNIDDDEEHKKNINKMDAMEDILLDDFSQGSSDEEDENV